MSINVNVGTIIPTAVVEVGNEITAEQLAAITSATGASGSNPFTTATHTHVISNVTGLQTALDGKAESSHTHSISNITNLQTTLDGKSSTGHVHDITSISGLDSVLSEKAELVHTHVIADVTGLQTALDGKVGPIHTHTIANVTGLQTALDGKTDDSEFNSLEGRVDTLENNTASSVFPNGITTSLIKNILNEEIVVDAYNDTGAGTHFYHRFNPIDGRFYLASNGGGLVFPDSSIQYTASYSKAQSDAHLDTVATWVDTKADWGHTHVIADVTGLQTALDSKMAATQYWMEFDIGRIFTISNGVLSWDNGSSTLSHPMSGNNAGSFVFNKQVIFTPVLGKAGLNIGVGGTEAASTNAGDVWVNTSSSFLNFRDGNGIWRACLVNNQANSIDVSTATAPALRVTQRGAGEAFRVEDSTTPDSTAFIISNDGKVGIGQSIGTALIADLDIVKRSSSSWGVNIDAFTNGGNGLGLLVTGTGVSNTALQVNTGCARFEGGASFGNTQPVVSRISTPVIATGTYNREIEMVIGGSTFRIPCRQV